MRNINIFKKDFQLKLTTSDIVSFISYFFTFHTCLFKKKSDVFFQTIRLTFCFLFEKYHTVINLTVVLCEYKNLFYLHLSKNVKYNNTTNDVPYQP